jgi:hypothetical protein
MLECGWYGAEDNLSLYKANDTKYRYLKLNGGQSLYKALVSLDSLYMKDEKMRDWVIAREERNEKAFQLTQRAIQMEKEAKELKQQVDKNRRNQGLPIIQKRLRLRKESSNFYLVQCIIATIQCKMK